MNVSKKITIDLNGPSKEVVHLDQNDNTREIHLVLLCDGVPFAPEDGLTGVTKSVKYLAADGSGDENAGGVTIVSGTTNEYTVKLNHGETAVPGFTEVFVVFSKNGNILHTFPITLDVIKTDPDVSPSESSYGMFLRKDAQTAKTSGMTQAVGVDDNGKLWTTPGGGGGGEAVLYVEQTLNESEKTQARTNIGAGTYSKPSNGISIYDLKNDVQQSIARADNAVLITQQSLTDSQKGVARTNINAATPPSTVTISDSVVIISEAQDNTEYVCVSQLLTSITISAISSAATDFVLYFESQPGTTPVDLTVPSNVFFPPGFQVDVATYYEMSFVKRGSNWLVSVGAWDITT